MNFKRHHAVVLALLLMPGCAARRHQTRVTGFVRPMSREEWITPAPAPRSKPEPEYEPPRRAEEQRPSDPPVVVAAPKVKPKAFAPRRAPKKVQKKVQTVKRQKPRRVPPTGTAAPGDRGKDQSSDGFPWLYGLMPAGAAGLWMAGRAAAHAAKRG